MHLTHQYRLRPNATNRARFAEVMEQDRLLYNAALEERIKAHKWRQRRIEFPNFDPPEGELEKSINYNDQQSSLTQIRKQDEWFRAGHLKRQRGPLRRLDRAFKAFFRRMKAGEKPGFPRFKGANRWNGIEIDEDYRIKGKRFYSKDFPGGVRIHLHRPLPDNLVKHCGALIGHDGKGWFINLKIEVPASAQIPARKAIQNGVGIDVGLNAFVADSEGDFINPPKYFRSGEKRLRLLQRRLSRAKRGSHSREKKRQAVARQHLQVKNRRKTFLHAGALKLVNRYDLVAAEKLNVKGMIRNRHLSKSIADAGWGAFLDKVAYKAEEAGKRFVQVDPRDTSQQCSGCGAIVKKPLSQRVHRCGECGLTLDRDTNAARNILNRAVSVLASESSVRPLPGAEFDAEIPRNQATSA